MGCKILDLLPLTNTPDLTVVENEMNKFKERQAKEEKITPEYLKKFFIDNVCSIETPDVHDTSRYIYNTAHDMRNALLSNDTDRYGSFRYIDEYHIPEAFDILIQSIKFSDAKEVLNRNSRYSLIYNNLPAAKMDDVRQLAENLHMVIMPVEFSHPQILFGNDSKLNKMFSMYDAASNDNLYVMCPINFYNHYRHIISKSDKPIFIPTKFQHIFDTLEITRSTLSFIIDKIDENSQEILSLNKRVDDLANRVDILENIEKERREEQRRAAMEFKYRQLDPMIINIPVDQDVNSWDGETKIHMLWGEDLPDILLENNKLKVFKDNKNAHPEKIYDFIEKGFDASAPTIRFKQFETTINKYFTGDEKETISDKVWRYYQQYCDMVGTPPSSYNWHTGKSISTIEQAYISALKIITIALRTDISQLSI